MALKNFLKNLQFAAFILVTACIIMLGLFLIFGAPAIAIMFLELWSIPVVLLYIAALISVSEYLSDKDWVVKLIDKFLKLIPEKFKDQ